MFKKDEHDKNRNWREIEEKKIRDLHSSCKNNMEQVMAEFKFIKLPRP